MRRLFLIALAVVILVGVAALAAGPTINPEPKCGEVSVPASWGKVVNVFGYAGQTFCLTAFVTFQADDGTVRILRINSGEDRLVNVLRRSQD